MPSAAERRDDENRRVAEKILDGLAVYGHDRNGMDPIKWLSIIIEGVRRQSGSQAGRILELQHLQAVAARRKRAIRNAVQERELLKDWLVSTGWVATRREVTDLLRGALHGLTAK